MIVSCRHSRFSILRKPSRFWCFVFAILSCLWRKGSRLHLPMFATGIEYSDHIANGQTQIEEFRWFTRIEDRNGKLKCSGAYIGSRFVLTADHCHGEKRLASDRQAVVGFFCLDTNNCNAGPKDVIPVKRWHQRPEGGDMAILELERAPVVEITPAIPFVKGLNEKQKKLKKKDKLILVGAGVVDSTSGARNHTSTLKTKTISRKACEKKISSDEIRKSLQDKRNSWICSVPRDDARPCAGDSGAALIAEGEKEWEGRDVVMALHLAGPKECEKQEAVGHPVIHFQMSKASSFVL